MHGTSITATTMGASGGKPELPPLYLAKSLLDYQSPPKPKKLKWNHVSQMTNDPELHMLLIEPQDYQTLVVMHKGHPEFKYFYKSKSGAAVTGGGADEWYLLWVF